MKTRTVEVREGELLGPIDWDYDFLSHFKHNSAQPETQQRWCEGSKAILHQIEANPTDWMVEVAHSHSEWPVLAVGMYDGWPYWKPTPAVLTGSPLGHEWRFFYDLVSARPLQAKTC